MKRTLIIIFITFISIPCFAQWKKAGFSPYPIIAFGVHDSSFFLSIPGHLYGYNVAVSDSGIDFTQGNITTFASLGNYFFCGSGPSSQGIGFVSTNNGLSWSEPPIGGPIGTNGTYIFAQYATRIARSTDSGKMWQHLPYDAGLSYVGTGAIVYANTTYSQILRSLDSGFTWLPLSPPFTGPMTMMGTILFINGSNGKVTETTDSGKDWNSIAVDTAGEQEGVTAFVTDGKNLFAGGGGVFLSTDTGKTWRAVNTGFSISFYPLHVTAMGIFDTLLFADLTANGEYNLFVRSIPEMLGDTAPSSVVQQLQPGDTIELYPNPAMGTVTILSGSTSLLGVSMLNVLGENVLDESNLRESDITLDVSKIPSGIYFLRIQTVESIVLRKIVINK